MAIRFQPLAKQEREQFGQRGQQVREAGEQRRKQEANPPKPSTAASTRGLTNPIRMRLPTVPGMTAKPIVVPANPGLPQAVTQTNAQEKMLKPTPVERRPNRSRETPQAGPQPERKIKPNAELPKAPPQVRPQLKPRPDRPKQSPQPAAPITPQQSPQPAAPIAPQQAPQPKAPKLQ